jgi:DNA-binding response OmpR family regulator
MICFGLAQFGSTRHDEMGISSLLRAAMQIRRITVSHEPVLLLDPQTDSAAELAGRLELNGFPTRIENTGAGAQAAIQEAYFATLIVIADLDDSACLGWLDELRRTAARSWMIVVSPRCDVKTCNLIYRHGGDACVTAPVSIDDLTRRLTAFQLRARPAF